MASTTRQQGFIAVGERIRFLGKSKYRYETWPKGKWLEYGVKGTVVEYHPESPAVRISGEYFEALPPYAVAELEFGSIARISIDAIDEGIRWERIKVGKEANLAKARRQ